MACFRYAPYALVIILIYAISQLRDEKYFRCSVIIDDITRKNLRIDLDIFLFLYTIA
jgi:hypothetical protein